jgi:hypothetical protein
MFSLCDTLREDVFLTLQFWRGSDFEDDADNIQKKRFRKYWSASSETRPLRGFRLVRDEEQK